MCCVFTVRMKNRLQPPFQSVNLGSTAKFTCISEITVTWHKEKRSINQNPINEQFGKYQDRDVYWLIITAITFDYAGIYTCNSFEENLILFDEGSLEIKSEHIIYFQDCPWFMKT